MVRLEGAHVLLVGATGGLGAAIGRALAEQGALLTLSGRRTDTLAALAAELGDAVLAVVPGDLAAPDFPAALVSQAHRREPLQGVIFAAGVVAFGEIAELTDEVLEQLLAINLAAPIRIARAAIPLLPAGGFLATISAVVAEQPMKGMAAYSASKAGLTAFDRAAAGELRRRQIRVLDIRPPHTETGLAQHPIAGEPPRLPVGGSPSAVADRIVRAITDDERDLPAAAFG